jgi:predicted SprT family Zn-dependent metalloprotease
MNTQANFTKLVELCLAIARERYGDFGNVTIRYDLRGLAAGQAKCKRSRLTGEAYDLELRFNREAMAKDWDHMVRETIPHEVAHLVAFARPDLGANNHNAGWTRIARSLGCKGDRCHTMALTPARRRYRFKYVTDSGVTVLAGPKYHKRIQELGRLAGLKCAQTGERIDRHHFKEKIAA